jgi:hypothetical protein
MAKWVSHTKQFGPIELAYIEQRPAGDLAVALLASEPLVVLRVLAEILLNGDLEKLDALLANPTVMAAWQGFETDQGVDERDRDYAQQLRARLPQT